MSKQEVTYSGKPEVETLNSIYRPSNANTHK